MVEQRPLQDGRNMTMMLAPSKAVLAGEKPPDDEGEPTGAGRGQGEQRAEPVAAAPRRGPQLGEARQTPARQSTASGWRPTPAGPTDAWRRMRRARAARARPSDARAAPRMPSLIQRHCSSCLLY